MGKRVRQFFCCFVAAALMVTSTPHLAYAKSYMTARRTFGLLFLSGSAVMAKKALDFRKDANDIFDAYKVARSADEAEQLFQRTSDRDTKSQMSIGLSLVLLVSGLRLLMASGVDDNIPKIDRRLKFDVKSDVRNQALKVALKKSF
jgi:hypothetical protein